METPQRIEGLRAGDVKALARAITVVENELEGADELLSSLRFKETIPVVGFTGPPGAGKSTLINALVRDIVQQGKSVGIVAIDPTSPFNFGSLLGDRLRMSEHFGNDKVFIRSLATRGSLGGLTAKAIEVVDVMRAFGFDYIFVETVGVGQSEVEVAGLADTTVLVLVPESGDEVQTMKSGIMEIADVFVVNKADRPGADEFAKNLQHLVHGRQDSSWQPPVIKAVAAGGEGSREILEAIEAHGKKEKNGRKAMLLTEKAWRLIQSRRMKDVDKNELQRKIREAMEKEDFNFYVFVEGFDKGWGRRE